MSLTNLAEVKTLDYTTRKNLIIMPCHLSTYGEQHTFIGIETELYDSNGDLRWYQGYKCAECNPKVDTFFENNFIVVSSTLSTDINKLSLNTKREMREKYQQHVTTKEINQKVEEFAQRLDNYLQVANKPQIVLNKENPNYGKYEKNEENFVQKYSCKFLEKENDDKNLDVSGLKWPDVYDSSFHLFDKKKKYPRIFLPSYSIPPKYVSDSESDTDDDMPELVDEDMPELVDDDMPEEEVDGKDVDNDIPELVDSEKDNVEDKFIDGACRFYTSNTKSQPYIFWNNILYFHDKYSAVLKELTQKYQKSETPYVPEVTYMDDTYYEIHC
jgi:hypothetical protein